MINSDSHQMPDLEVQSHTLCIDTQTAEQHKDTVSDSNRIKAKDRVSVEEKRFDLGVQYVIVCMNYVCVCVCPTER